MKPLKFKKIYCEISNCCNLKCDFCPSSVDSDTEKRFMPVELFAKLVPQLQPLTNLLCLHVMGEPLCHPELGKFLDICSEHDLKVPIVTNGTLLNENHRQLLKHPAVTQINFSLQSFDANFPQENNESYLNTIFEFTAEALSARSDLYINFRLWNSESFRESLNTNRLIIEQISDFFDLPENIMADLSFRGNLLSQNLYLNFADRFEWPAMAKPSRGESGTCLGLRHQFAILADGNVVPCCLDWEGVIKLGNCQDQTIREILNSARATAILEGFRKYRLIEPLCQHCSFNQRFS